MVNHQISHCQTTVRLPKVRDRVSGNSVGLVISDWDVCYLIFINLTQYNRLLQIFLFFSHSVYTDTNTEDSLGFVKKKIICEDISQLHLP